MNSSSNPSYNKSSLSPPFLLQNLQTTPPPPLSSSCSDPISGAAPDRLRRPPQVRIYLKSSADLDLPSSVVAAPIRSDDCRSSLKEKEGRELREMERDCSGGARPGGRKKMRSRRVGFEEDGFEGGRDGGSGVAISSGGGGHGGFEGGEAIAEARRAESDEGLVGVEGAREGSGDCRSAPIRSGDYGSAPIRSDLSLVASMASMDGDLERIWEGIWGG